MVLLHMEARTAQKRQFGEISFLNVITNNVRQCYVRYLTYLMCSNIWFAYLFVDSLLIVVDYYA